MEKASSSSRLLLALTSAAALLLIGFLVARGVLREAPGVNSYGALAQAWLGGRLDIGACPEIDCAVFGGKTFIIFPPLPALVAMPFVAVFGFKAFSGFILLGIASAVASLFVWRSIFRALDLDSATARWFLVAIALGSPLYQVVLRSDGVWFFAQSIGFLLVSLSLWAGVVRASLPLACGFAALAFLCRQMAIFYPLFLLALTWPRQTSFVDGIRRQSRPVLLAAIPVLAALALYFIYNWVRFGNPLDTGYSYIANPGPQSFIGKRIADIGLFSKEYLTFNAIYLLFQGPHFEFAEPVLTRISGFDKIGVALPIASPWLLLALHLRRDWTMATGLAVIGIIAGLTLFYHSNGASQINTQRYALDWLPILLVLMARSARHPAFAALPALVAWACVSNAAVVGLVAYYRL